MIAMIPGVLVVMNVVYAASAYPFGRLADLVSRRMLLMLGAIFLIAADIVLAAAGTVWQVAAGVVLWGLHMGATQGLLSTLVVDAAPADLRGTALGMFNLITEVAYSLESLCSECCPGKPTANKARPLSSKPAIADPA